MKLKHKKEKPADKQPKLWDIISNPSAPSLAAHEFAAGIDITKILEEEQIILPPSYSKSASSIDFMKFFCYEAIKGEKLHDRALNHLKKNLEKANKMGITRLPEDVGQIYYFISKRLGKHNYERFILAAKKSMYDTSIFVRDSTENVKRKKNAVTVINKNAKGSARYVKKFIINQIKNNQRDNAKYTDKQINRILFDACMGFEESINSICSRAREYEANPHMPTEKQVLYRIEQFASNPDQTKYFDDILKKLMVEFKKRDPSRFSRRKFTLLIDITAIATWIDPEKSPNPEYLLQDSHIKVQGTDIFQKYIVAAIIIDNMTLPIGFIPLISTADLHKHVETLFYKARSLVPINLVLMDRQFETDGCLSLCNDIKVNYITPSKDHEKNRKIAETMNEDVLICPKTLNNKVVGKLIIFRKEVKFLEYEYLYFTTNMDVDLTNVQKVPEIYRTRWNIENIFRDAEFFRPVTTTPDNKKRSYLFGMSLITFNAWILANFIIVILYIKGIPKKPPIEKKRFKELLFNSGPDPPPNPPHFE